MPPRVMGKIHDQQISVIGFTNRPWQAACPSRVKAVQQKKKRASLCISLLAFLLRGNFARFLGFKLLIERLNMS